MKLAVKSLLPLLLGCAGALAADRPLVVSSGTDFRTSMLRPQHIVFHAEGGAGRYAWTVANGDLPPGLTLRANGLLAGLPSASGTFVFDLRVADGQHRTVVQRTTIAVYSASMPAITTPADLDSLQTGTTGSYALEAAGGTPPYRWSAEDALPQDFTLANNTLLARLNSPGRRQVRIRVTDAGGQTDVETFTVSSSEALIDSDTLTPPVLGQPWQQALIATGGRAPYTWAITEGTLPAGIDLSEAGVISGAAISLNSEAPCFRLSARDAEERVTSQRVCLEVRQPDAATFIASQPLLLSVGERLAALLAVPGRWNWQVQSGSLPAGVSLLANGQLAGEATAPGSFSTVLAANGVQQSIRIDVSPLLIGPRSLKGVVNEPVALHLTASGGRAPYVWSMPDGSVLPDGLSLSEDGAIQGSTAFSGTVQFPVKVTDADGLSLIKDVTLEFGRANAAGTNVTTQTAAALTITTVSPLPVATPNVAYTQTLAVSGGTGPYSWSVTNSSLPPGITLSAGGVLSGSTNSCYVATFTAQVTDSTSTSTSKNFEVGFACANPSAPSFQGTALGEFSQGSFFSTSFFYSAAGTPYYTFAVASGSTLPPGVSLTSDPAGTFFFSGTPTTPGTYIFSVQLTDGAAHIAVEPFSMVVSPITVTTAINFSFPYNAAINPVTLSATGGTGTLTWTVVQGSLPAGLSLSTTGVLSGTPTDTGNTSCAIRVSDAGGHSRTVSGNFAISGPPVTISSSGPLVTSLGQPFTLGLTGVGSAGAINWSVATESTLPAGLGLVQGQDYSAQIWGVPTTAGVFTFSIKATDTANNVGLRTFSLTVTPLYDASGDFGIGTPVVGRAYSRQFLVAGGTPPYTFAVSPGYPLPLGLTLSSGGLISGTPTFPYPGGTKFAVDVSDSASHIATFTYTTPVQSFYITNSPLLPNATTFATYSAAFAAAGGASPYTFTFSYPTTTSPIFFNTTSAGQISGTAGPGEFDLTARATDSNANSAGQRFSLFATTSPPGALLITSTNALGETSAGSLTNFTLSAAGGVPPYTWTVANGSSLPAGMSLTSGIAAPGVTPFSPMGFPGYNNLYGIPSAAGNYSFTLQVADNAGHTANQAFSMTVSPVTILNAGLTATMGVAYTHTFIAIGGTAPYTWALAPGSYLPNGLSLANGVISGTPQENGTLTFAITARDAVNNTRTVTFTMFISSGTACPINFTTDPQLPNGYVNQSYNANLFFGGCAASSFSLVNGSTLPPGLQLQPNNIVGVPTAGGSYTFGIQATDASGNRGVRYFRLNITGLVNTTYPIAPATIGGAYSQTFTVAGGTAPYTWTLCAGSMLPPGLSLSSAGVLSGTPTQFGGFNFSLCVADNGSATAAFPVFVNVELLSITTPAAVPNVTVGQSYSLQLNAAGGTAPYTWTLGFSCGGTCRYYNNLPSGLTLNVTTGLISGTTTLTSGTSYTFGITLTDNNGNTASKLFGGYVVPATVSQTSPIVYTTIGALGTIPVGQPYSTSLSGFSYNGPYTWSAAPGSQLPPGLSIQTDPTNPSGFMLAGIPAVPGTYIFTLRLVDAYAAVSQTFSLTVSSLSVSNNSGLPNAIVGAAYTSTLTGLGGVAPYRWSTLPGYPLPAGLSLSSAGVLSGTPTESGGFYLRVLLSDSAGTLVPVFAYLFIQSGTPVVLGISGPYPMPSAFVQQEYNQTFQFSGGTGPYTYSLFSGTLPPGMQLLPGALPGTSASLWGAPTTAGTYTFTIKVTDSAGNTGYRTPVVTVSPLANAVPALPNGSVGVAYSQQLSVVGAAGPYTWSLLRGPYPISPNCPGCTPNYKDSLLPPGMNLSASGSLSGTPLNAGTYLFQVLALDNAGDPLVLSYTLTVTPLTITNQRLLPTATLNTAYSAAFTAAGGSQPYNFWLPTTTAVPVGITLAANGTLSGTPTSTGLFNFVVSVQDSARNLYSNTFTLLVSPTALSPLTIMWPGSAGYTSSPLLTLMPSGSTVGIDFQATGGLPPYTWTVPPGYLLPNGLTLTSNGQLTGLAETPGSFSLAIRVTDSAGTSATELFYLPVSPLKIYPNLPQGTVGTAYSTTLVAIGGAPPYTFSIGPGSSLPTGLSLDSQGHLTGTPTDSGTLNFDVRVTDANGATFVRTVQVSFAASTTTTYTISGAPLPDAQPNGSYSASIYGAPALGPCCLATSYQWTLAPGSSLPAGLTLSTSGSLSASISGSVATAGHYSFRILLTDNLGNVGYRTFTLNVTPLVSTPGAGNATVGTVFQKNVTVNGGTGPYTYTVAPGYVLPPGFSLNTATGVITGTGTTPGQYSVGVLVTDAAGNTTVVTFTLTINAVGITSPALLPTGKVGVAYSQQLTAAGGTQPYTWTASNLPNGLALSTAGVLSGAPTGTGLFTFTVIAVDSAFNGAASTSLSMYIAGALPSLPVPQGFFAPNLVLGSVLSPVVETAVGGTPPYTWSIAGGSLPPGIQLATDPLGRAVVTGTALQPGNYAAEVQVTDANGVTGFSVWTLTVYPTPVYLTATLNTSFSANLTMSGGTSPYTFVVAPTGLLPAGMSLSTAGLLSGTPTDTGTQYFDVDVTDATNVLTHLTVPFSVTAQTGPTISLNVGSSPLFRLTTNSPTSVGFSASGGTAPYTIALANGSNLPLGMSLQGQTIAGAPTTAGTYTTVIKATDANGVTGTLTLEFIVSPGPFQIFTRTFPIIPSGTPVNLNLNAVGGTTPYTWTVAPNSVLPPGLVLSSQGVLSGTPTLGGQFQFNAVFTDSSTPANRQTTFFILRVSPVTLTTAGPLPNAATGVAYAQAFAATGGTAPYTFWLPTTTSVPAGFTLTTNGVLAGTTAAAGSYTFTVNAADAKGWVVSTSYRLNVVSTPSPFPLAAVPLAPSAATVPAGVTTDIQLTAQGGTPPFTWSVAQGSALPAGLSIQQAATLPVPTYTPGDAILTGVIANPGIYSFALNLTDSATPAVTVSRTYQLIASTLAANTIPASFLGLSGTTGTAMQAAFVIAGGTAPYNVSTFSGALPNGVTMTSAGVISGTPVDPGSFSTTFLITDSLSPVLSIYRILSFNIAAPFGASSLRWSTGSNLGIVPKNGTVSLALTATGGIGPYTFSVPNGSTVPAGISLNSGVLSGSPTTSGKYTFTLTVTDAVNTSLTRQFYLEVSPISLSPNTLPSATQGTAYSTTITAAGGTGPLSLTASTLPAGLSITAAGALSGTPSSSGTANVGLLVYDSANPANVVSVIEPLTIAAPAPPPCTSCGGGGSPPPAASATLTFSPNSLAFQGWVGGTQTSQLTLQGIPLSNVSLSTNCDAASRWLTVSPQSAALHEGISQNLLVSVNATGLAAGTYTCRVSASAANASGTSPLTVTLTVATPIVTNRAALAFTWTRGDAPPPIQYVQVSSTPTGVAYSVSASTLSGGSWLVVPAGFSATTNTSFPVSIDTRSLQSAGSYSGTVTVTPAQGSIVTLPVSVTVTDVRNPQLSVSPLTEQFALTTTSNPANGQLVVSNTGGGTLSFNVSATSDKGWLTLSGSGSGSATAGNPQSLAYVVDPTGLRAGSYAGTIVVRDNNSTAQATVNISLSVTSRASLVLSRNGLAFSTSQGGPGAPQQTFEVFAEGSPAPTFNVQTKVYYNPQLTLPSNPNWLSASPLSGTATTGSAGVPITVTANAAGLPPGQYFGAVVVSAAGADNSPQSVAVVLNVAAPAAPQSTQVQISSGGVILVGTAGGSTAQQQTITLFNPSTSPVTFSTNLSSSGWLSVTPSSGSLAPGLDTITINADFSALQQGVQTGSVRLSAGATSGTIQVDAIATSSSARLRAGILRTGTLRALDVAPCTAGKPGFVLAVLRQPVGLSSVAAATPQLVQALVYDGCGNAVTAAAGGTVEVNFSNGDPSIHLADVGSGVWEATWVPVNAGPSVTVNVVAAEGSAAQYGPASATVAVTAAAAASPAAVTGVANAASAASAVAQTVTPSSYVGVYGTNLADVDCTDPAAIATSFPLPTTLNGAQVQLGGTAVPIVFACRTQINIIVPQAATANARSQLVVLRDGTVSVPQTIAVAGLQPGIFTLDQSGAGQGVAEISGTALLAGATSSFARPVKRGSEFLSVYATGLGSVAGPNGEPEPADGAAASSTLLFTTSAKVTATIGGVSAPVQFSGLTPTLAWLYQVNVAVPANAPTGDAVPLVITATDSDGVAFASNTVTIAVQ